MLEKTRTLMMMSNEQPGTVEFSCEPDEDMRNHAFRVDRGVWEDMGRPETITVTIEPGDKLNV